MRKLISVLTVFLLLFVLSAPVFAADANAEISYIPSATYEVEEADTEDGYHVEIRPTDPSTVNEEGLLKTAAENEKVKAAGELAGYDVLDIVMVRDSDGEVVEWNEPITVVVTYDRSSQVVVVFVQNDDEGKTWEEVPYEITGDNLITLHMPHLSTVAFTIQELQPLPPEQTPGKPSGTNRVSSPQTGYPVTALWVMAAAVSAVCCAACLLRARKIAE